MKRAKLLAWGLAMCLGAAGCESQRAAAPGTPRFPYGEYQYVAYDIHQTQVARGRFTLAALPVQPGSFVGSWRSESADAGRLLDGDGQLRGAVRGNVVAMNLRPGQSGDVVFIGAIEQDLLTGTWQRSGAAMPQGQGTFEAIRMEGTGDTGVIDPLLHLPPSKR